MIQLQESPNSMFPERLNPAPATPYLWRDLYRRAIFERERSKIPMRIRAAEAALMHREHELCANQQSVAERESIVTALNCLRALRTCMKAA